MGTSRTPSFLPKNPTFTTVTATTVTSAVVGDVTGNASGSSGSCTGNAATATSAAACTGNSATATTAAACSGNAATATVLATTRAINGVNFNGGAAIEIKNFVGAAAAAAPNTTIVDYGGAPGGRVIACGPDAATLGTLNLLLLSANASVASNVGVVSSAGITSNANLVATTFQKTGAVTVANLPNAAAAGIGATYFVTDANATFILGLGLAVVGGGANKVPVYSDGANWIVG